MESRSSQLSYRELASELLNKLETGEILSSGAVAFTPVGCSISPATGNMLLAISANFSVFDQLSQQNAGLTLPSRDRYRINIDQLRRFVKRTATIFYCWQSWSPRETNKDFILSALQSAVKEVNLRSGITLQIDSDTQGVPGSVGFSDTILKKITASEIFVADLTAVGANRDKTKKLPNGNVMFEYGFATATHVPERMVVLHNSAFGKVEEFPSDVLHRSAIQYCCAQSSDETERSAQLSSLSKKLVTELTYMAAEIPRLSVAFKTGEE